MTTRKVWEAGSLLGLAGAALMVMAQPAAALTYTADIQLTNPKISGARAGLFNGTVLSKDAGLPPLYPGGNDNPDKFYAWCINPNQVLDPTNTVYTIYALEGAPVNGAAAPPTQMGVSTSSGGVLTNADVMRYLVGTVMPNIDGVITAGYDMGIGTVLDPLTNQERIDAFQLALWEIAYERAAPAAGGFGLTDGTFNIALLLSGSPWLGSESAGLNNAQTLALADAWIADILVTASGGTSAKTWTLATDIWALENPNQQGFLVKVTDETNENLPRVPVPAAAWLFGSALLGTLAIARRRKKIA